MKLLTYIIITFSIIVTISYTQSYRVPKWENSKKVVQKTVSEYRNSSGNRDFCPPQYPNNPSTFMTVIDSSASGMGVYSTVVRPIDVNSDGNILVVYRQYAGENTTHGQLGAASSTGGDSGLEWNVHYNVNYNGNPPWGGGGVGGDNTAQARYPSGIASEEYPYAIWSEEAGSGRPYFAYDEYGWDGESWIYPIEIDQFYGDKSLYNGSIGYGYDAANGELHVNVVYEDYNSGGKYLFTTESVEDGNLVFGPEIMMVNPNHLGENGYSTSAILSMNDNGQGILGLVGIFAGNNPSTGYCGPPASNVTCNKTPMFKITDNYGQSWTGNHLAFGFNYVPDALFDDITLNWPEYDINPCTGEYSNINGFWSWNNFDMRVDSEGNPHFVISMVAESDNYYHFFDGQTGFYHLTIDRDMLNNNHDINPQWINTPQGWNWSYIPLPANDSFIWNTPSGNSYLYSTMCQLSIDRYNPNVISVVANIAAKGEMSSDHDQNGDGAEDDPCDTQNAPWELYPEWSEDIWLISSLNNGASWNFSENVTMTPRNPDLSGPNNCAPEEQFPHTAHWSNGIQVFYTYNQPNWGFNEMNDLDGESYMNRIFAGYSSFTETEDCNNEYQGGAFYNECGVCVGGNTGLEANTGIDCDGVCFGSNYFPDECGIECGNNSSCSDECGVPYGDNSSCTDGCGIINGDNSSCADECGVPYGDNSSCTDGCGIINGDNSTCAGCMEPTACNYDETAIIEGECSYPSELFDCNGDCIPGIDCAGSCGTAFQNSCGVCVGGGTGLSETTGMDCDGVCWGSASCFGCMDPNACNFDPIADDDDGSCFSVDNCLPELGDINGSGNWNVLDIVTLANCVLAMICDVIENGCAGDLNSDGGYNVLDMVILANCVLADNCGISSSYDVICDCEGTIMDCGGVCDGNSVLDDCGICAGNGLPCGRMGMLSLSENDLGLWDVNYTNTPLIAGFQFNVEGVTVLSAGGGASEDYGFLITASSTTVIGFSIIGGTIPAGSGTLLTLNLSSSPLGLSDITISDPNGNQLDIIYDENYGCTDESAFNYDSDALNDDSSCIYYGDVTIDGNINVLDIVMIIDYILNGFGLDETQYALADYNQDGVVNVIDIVAIINQILGGNLSRGKATNEATLLYGKNVLSIKSDGDLAGIQLEIIGDYSITKNFLPVGWEIANSENTILMYSQDGSILESNILFEYTGEMTIESAIAADWYESDISVSSIMLPKEYTLSAAYPNPFNPVTNLSFALPQDDIVTIVIYNLQGKVVETLVSDYLTSGYHSVVWDANSYASGVYFVKMVAGEFVNTQKLMLVK